MDMSIVWFPCFSKVDSGEILQRSLYPPEKTFVESPWGQKTASSAQGLHVNAVRTAARVKLNHEVFWKAIWEAYNWERWPGSHRIAFEGSRTFPKEVLGFGTIDALIVIMSCLEETSLKLVPAPSQATPASFRPKQKGSGSGGSCSSSRKWLRSSREN